MRVSLLFSYKRTASRLREMDGGSGQELTSFLGWFGSVDAAAAAFNPQAVLRYH